MRSDARPTVRRVVVAGPTGVGKTDRAIALARKLGDAPIVVLDRVQCHAELAVGSGRRMVVGERSMADEVRALWPDRRTHPVLGDIVGYREVVAAMRAAETPDLSQRARKALVPVVTEAHLAYAHEQCRRILGVLPLLRSAPVHHPG